LIDGWLTADREAPRKQRYTAKRVWRRLVDEHGVDVAERTVRDHVRRRRRELGLSADGQEGLAGSSPTDGSMPGSQRAVS